MEPNDLTVQILREIRDEVRNTNAGVDQTNERLEHLRLDVDQRLDQVREELGDLREELGDLRGELSARIVESEMRTATAITELAGAFKISPNSSRLSTT